MENLQNVKFFLFESEYCLQEMKWRLASKPLVMMKEAECDGDPSHASKIEKTSYLYMVTPRTMSC
jgi:hypothetical protein